MAASRIMELLPGDIGPTGRPLPAFPGFDWGLPFFYGRSVYTAIAGHTAGSAIGPYFAY